MNNHRSIRFNLRSNFINRQFAIFALLNKYILRKQNPTKARNALQKTKAATSVSLSLFMKSKARVSLRKHAYSNILKILQPKKENFQIKNSDIFHISAQNIDCGYSLGPPR